MRNSMQKSFPSIPDGIAGIFRLLLLLSNFLSIVTDFSDIQGF